MNSIFNADGNAELISRINQLSATTPALWGKMNPAQMMAHCCKGMNMALGNTKTKRFWLGIVFGNIAKKRLLSRGDFDRYMPTFKGFEITDDCDFEVEKENLTTLIKSAFEKGECCVVKYPHPYFSRFKPGEWAQLNLKHLDHHLRQFGV